VFIFWIPESPAFLFVKNPKSKEGIKVLNYIAKFNGSPYRFQEGTVSVKVNSQESNEP
jgi:hypothetical protein